METVYCETDRMVIYEEKLPSFDGTHYDEIHYYGFLKEYVQENNGKALLEIVLTLHQGFYCENRNLGFHVNGSENKNKGYMTEALTAIKDSIIEHEMEACAWATNIASCKVLEKFFSHCKEIEVDKVVSVEAGFNLIREKRIVKIYSL